MIDWLVVAIIFPPISIIQSFHTLIQGFSFLDIEKQKEVF